MIHRVGQDYDRCPSEVIMCGRTLAGRALRCAPMVGSRREQSPRLAFTERADPAGSVARALELSVMVPSLVVSIRGAQRSIRDRSGRRAQELRNQADTPDRGAR